MFNIFYIFGTLILISTCYSLGIYVLSVQILSEKIVKKCAVFYCSIFYGIQVIANIFLMQGVTYDETFMIAWNIYLYTLHVAILVFLLLWTYRRNTVQTVTAGALAHFIVFTMGSLSEEVLVSYVPKMENVYLYGVLVTILPHVIMLIWSLAMVLLLRKLEFDRYFQAMFSSRIGAILTLIVSLVLMHVHTIIRLLYPLEKVSLITASYSVALIVIALLFLLYAARYRDSRERVKAQEAIILQQQTHLVLLEELQQEMRAFRHDFNNLMTGMTLQVQEGDLKGIQDFMHHTSNYFDERLGDEIKNLEAVSRIHIPSLRSLITSKIAFMQKEGVHPNVEILYPILEEVIRQHDLLRILGILLDNALEEAKKSIQPRITLVLFQTETELFMAVANSYDISPDLSLMNDNNYTTKGSAHGTGLMSLRKIVKKYPGCSRSMKIKDDMFHYEIRIPRLSV